MSLRHHKQIPDSDCCVYCLDKWPCSADRIRTEALADVMVYVVTTGKYDEERIVAVATSEADGRRLMREAYEANGRDPAAFYGPFQPGEIGKCTSHDRRFCIVCSEVVDFLD